MGTLTDHVWGNPEYDEELQDAAIEEEEGEEGEEGEGEGEGDTDAE